MDINTAPLKPDLERAIKWYKKNIVEMEEELSATLDEYGFENGLPSWKWEQFIAILVGDRKKSVTEGRNSTNGKGSDLENYEIKSRLNGASFGYKYHKFSWADKLREEARISHVYISYWEKYKDLDVRLIPGSNLTDLLSAWTPEIKLNFENESGSKHLESARFGIPFKTVCERGSLILSVRNQEVIQYSPTLEYSSKVAAK